MIVFIDIDGVLADFVGRIAKLTKRTVEELVVRGTYNAVAGIGRTEEEMWEIVNSDRRNFFACLKLYPWANSFLKTIENKVGKNNVAILSSPAKGPKYGPECVAGKVRWIYDNLNPRYYKRYFLGSAKEIMAHPDAVLIDDADKKIKRFQKAGGHGIVFPQIWNSKHKLATPDARLDYVYQKLDDILENKT